jgi:hypothetical protein
MKKLKQQPLSKAAHVGIDGLASRSTNGLTPHFSLEYLQSGYKVSDCEKEAQAALAERLEKLGVMTWAEIISTRKETYGCEELSVNNISGLPPSIKNVHKKLLIFRFGQAERLTGYREGRTLHIVLVSANHGTHKG